MADPYSVLVLNSGSSSVKWAVVDPRSGETSSSGIGERLSTPEARLRTRVAGGEWQDTPMPGLTPGNAVQQAIRLVRDLPGIIIGGVGHRIVHGGARFTESVRIDPDVVLAITAVSELAPLHTPVNLAGIREAELALPDVPHVAVFDTAFHQTMPATAYRYAVPTEWYESFGVRRYGFHGTSHRYVSAEAALVLDRPLEDLALVTAHLGNGCSATAVLGGKSVDTTMGMTPLEGLVMGSRSGDVDPGLFGYLFERAGLTVSDVTAALNQDSGMLGLSGLSNDLRIIEAATDNPDAALALDVFSYRLAKAVAALVVSMGRLDALVFTGGIGERSVVVRSKVLGLLGFLGLEENIIANADHGIHHQGRVSLMGHPVALVIPTNEELVIARDTAAIVDAIAR